MGKPIVQTQHTTACTTQYKCTRVSHMGKNAGTYTNKTAQPPNSGTQGNLLGLIVRIFQGQKWGSQRFPCPQPSLKRTRDQGPCSSEDIRISITCYSRVWGARMANARAHFVLSRWITPLPHTQSQPAQNVCRRRLDATPQGMCYPATHHWWLRSDTLISRGSAQQRHKKAPKPKAAHGGPHAHTRTRGGSLHLLRRRAHAHVELVA